MLLSIIIIEYHSRGEVERCIRSLKAKAKLPIEIIVSSNSRYPEDVQQDILQNAGDAHWIFNERNGGFAYAMNTGLAVATGDYLAITNPDCTVCTGFDKMVALLEEHPEVGLVAPKVCAMNGELQDTARPYVTFPRATKRFFKVLMQKKESVLENDMDYNAVQTVDWVAGAFFIVSRKAYEVTGGLDSRYFMYAEDLDWCTRIRKAGLEIVYFPHEKVIFKGTRRARHDFRFTPIFLKSHFLYWFKFGFFWGHPKRKEILFEK